MGRDRNVDQLTERSHPKCTWVAKQLRNKPAELEHSQVHSQ
jgi:hypothetical protein